MVTSSVHGRVATSMPPEPVDEEISPEVVDPSNDAQFDLERNLLLRPHMEKVRHYQALGLSKIGITKLLLPDTQLELAQQVECIRTCVEVGSANAHTTRHQRLVIALGDSGSGKSTVLNYILGHTMILREQVAGEGDFVIEVVPSEPEEGELDFLPTMSIGHDETSHTILPQTVHCAAIGSILMDLPGLADNRGEELGASCFGANLVRVGAR
jgi:hypothetical protein